MAHANFTCAYISHKAFRAKFRRLQSTRSDIHNELKRPLTCENTQTNLYVSSGIRKPTRKALERSWEGFPARERTFDVVLWPRINLWCVLSDVICCRWCVCCVLLRVACMSDRNGFLIGILFVRVRLSCFR